MAGNRNRQDADGGASDDEHAHHRAAASAIVGLWRKGLGMGAKR